MSKLISDIFTKDKVIFDIINTFNTPWNKEEFTASSLDLTYFFRSADKEISRTVEIMLGEDESLTEASRAELATLIKNYFLNDWKYEYEALLAAYNPIHNYDMTETETAETNISDTTGNTQTSTTQDTTTSNGTNSNTNKVYGFNSTAGVNYSEQNGTDSRTDTNSGNTSITDSGTHTGTNGTDRTLTRSGNIGITTSQQMIESELNLRKKHYFDIVMNDIDFILTSRVNEWEA